MAFDLDLSLVNLKGDGALLAYLTCRRKEGDSDGASKQPLKTSQAPGTHSLLLEASSTLYQTYEMHSCMTFNMTLSTQLLSRTVSFPPWPHCTSCGTFFFLINYLFFNCFTELCVGFYQTSTACGILVPWVRNLTCTSCSWSMES